MSSIRVSPYFSLMHIHWTEGAVNNLKRGATFSVSILVMSTAGSMFTFSSFSEGLRTRFNYDSTQLNLVSALGNAALYATLLMAGFLYDIFGAVWTLFLGGVIYGSGYLLMYLTYIGTLQNSSVGLVSLYYFLAGFGSATTYMSATGINVMNFSRSSSGLITGVLLLFYGLSATIYSQIYSTNLMSTGSFLLFLALSTFIVNILASFLFFKTPAPPENPKNSKIKLPSHLLSVTPTSITSSSSASSDESKHLSPYYSIKSRRSSEKAIIGAGTPIGFSQQVVDQRDLPDDHEMNSLETVVDEELAANGSSNDEKIVISHDSPIKRKSLWFSGLTAYASYEKEEEEVHLTPFEMLKTLTFFLFATTYITQQGLSYFSNIATIITSLSGPDTDTTLLPKMISTHVTILSVFNSFGRFVFGLLCDVLRASWPRIDRSLLLVLVEILMMVPIIILGWGDVTFNKLYLCSVLVGLSFGASASLFPFLTRDFFGLKFYGTACGLVMVAVPAGIVTSNMVFGYFYDAQLKRMSPTATVCYGAACFKTSFTIQAVIQLIAVATALGLFCFRMWVRKRR